MPRYDETDNLTWRHEDGSHCPVFWSDRPGTADGKRWWCTEHQQHLTADVALMDLTEDERKALPAVHHRPVFDGLGVPHSWICAVCWGDGWTTRWPCEPATVGGVELGRVLGLEVHY